MDYGVNFYDSDNCVVRNCHFFGNHGPAGRPLAVVDELADLVPLGPMYVSRLDAATIPASQWTTRSG